MYIPVIVGSIRSGRNTPRLAQFLQRQLDGIDGVETEMFDPRAMGLPLLEERLSHLENPPPALVTFGAAIARADGVVICTPEYNKGYPAALKNLVDALGSEWRRKPVAIAAHSVGAFGGAVALQALRPVMLALGALPIPATMTVPHVNRAFAEDGTPQEPELVDRTGRFLDEFLWYVRALARAGDAVE
jgi:NAD(P)H-dependent FMN reductase